MRQEYLSRVKYAIYPMQLVALVWYSVYYLSLFPIPASCATTIERRFRNFLREGSKDKRGTHNLRWEKIKLPLEEGGLEIIDIKHKNKSFWLNWHGDFTLLYEEKSMLQILAPLTLITNWLTLHSVPPRAPEDIFRMVNYMFSPTFNVTPQPELPLSSTRWSVKTAVINFLVDSHCQLTIFPSFKHFF